MRCPICKAKRRGRPDELGLPELLDHFLQEHPMEAIAMARAQLQEQAVDLTDVVFEEAPNDGT